LAVRLDGMTDPIPTAGPAAERKTLPRDLADFLIEFSIGINKYAMYPGGHPSLRPAAERVVNRLQTLLVERNSLSLGVARQQLVIEGVATDPKNPVLGDLAGRLHRHQLGAITFRRGLEPLEMQDVLVVISQEADRMEIPLGALPHDQLRRWSNIQLYPLNYERLDIVDEGDDDDELESHRSERDRDSRTRAAQLWVGLARAAIAVDEGEVKSDTDINTDPAAIATAIKQHEGKSAYDQVIVGYMLQIADELRGGGHEAIELRKRMSKMVSSLDEATVGRLLEMGGDRVQRRKFLLDASQGLALDAVVDLVQAAAETHEQNISHSLIRMLQKMAQHTESSSQTQRALADENARAQIAALITNWSLTDPNPDSYRKALERMAYSESVIKVSPEAQYQPEPKRIVQMAIEVDTTGEPLWEAIQELSDAGEFGWVLDTVRKGKGANLLREFWERFGSDEHIHAIASQEPLEPEVLGTIIAKVGSRAATPLLDVLAESESSQTRRYLVNCIAEFGPKISDEIIRRLADERWFVIRNLLAIMNEWEAFPDGFDGIAFLKHSDARVRREGMKIMLKDPTVRERTLAQAIADEDQRMIRTGLSAALGGCPDSVIPLVVTQATTASTGDLRTLAIKVLAENKLPIARDALVNIVAPRKTLFGTKLPPKSPEMLEAIGALHAIKDDPRAKRILDLAAKSRDEDIARAARGA